MEIPLKNSYDYFLSVWLNGSFCFLHNTPSPLSCKRYVDTWSAYACIYIYIYIKFWSLCFGVTGRQQSINQPRNQITLLSLKRICILQLMITSQIYGMVIKKCKWISRCIHYKNNSTGWHQYDSFSIQHSIGHRHKTPAIVRCFTFYTKYMEERREQVIRLSSDSTSLFQNCMVDYFGEFWYR